jgi:hypothetical protein
LNQIEPSSASKAKPPKGVKKTPPATEQREPGVAPFNNVTAERPADDFSVHFDLEDETAEKNHRVAMSATSLNRSLFTRRILLEKGASSIDVSGTIFSEFLFVSYLPWGALFHRSFNQ